MQKFPSIIWRQKTHARQTYLPPGHGGVDVHRSVLVPPEDGVGGAGDGAAEVELAAFEQGKDGTDSQTLECSGLEGGFRVSQRLLYPCA